MGLALLYYEKVFVRNREMVQYFKNISAAADNGSHLAQKRCHGKGNLKILIIDCFYVKFSFFL